MPVEMRKDDRYPATRDPATCAERAATRAAEAVRAAAAVASTASPTAAPVCWLVVKSAPASPWSSRRTPLVIAIDAVGRASPIPSEVRIRPGSTTLRYVACNEINLVARYVPQRR